MRADLSERLTAHPGELGVGREEIIRRSLRAYLPSRFDVSTGFVFDSSGDVSRQIDVVITDKLVCPRFETAGGIKYFPRASVVAIGQIKSSLTSEGELLRALENLESVKNLIDLLEEKQLTEFGANQSTTGTTISIRFLRSSSLPVKR